MNTDWQKAQMSSDQGGECVELRRYEGAVEIRDSKDPAGGTLRCSQTTADALLAAARRGDLDHLI